MINKNWIKINYLIIFLFLIIWSYLFYDPILLDNTNMLESNVDICTPKQDIDNPIIITPITPMDKVKSWCYWRLFIRNSSNYQRYSDFKSTWINNNYNFKSAFKFELKEIKSNPINYIKNNYKYKLHRIEEESKAMNAYYESLASAKNQNIYSPSDMNFFYKKGYSRAEIKWLGIQGYRVIKDKLVKPK